MRHSAQAPLDRPQPTASPASPATAKDTPTTNQHSFQRIPWTDRQATSTAAPLSLGSRSAALRRLVRRAIFAQAKCPPRKTREDLLTATLLLPSRVGRRHATTPPRPRPAFEAVLNEMEESNSPRPLDRKVPLKPSPRLSPEEKQADTEETTL